MVDPTGHQFDTHTKHCYAIAQEEDKHAHHRYAMQTSCPDEFMNMLGQVGWPFHQWPTEMKVGRLVQAMRERGAVPGTPEHVEG